MEVVFAGNGSAVHVLVLQLNVEPFFFQEYVIVLPAGGASHCTDGVAVPPALVSGLGLVLTEATHPVGAPGGGGGAVPQVIVTLLPLGVAMNAGQFASV